MRALIISYNNDDFIHHFPLGLAYIASAMEKESVHVDILTQDKDRCGIPNDLSNYDIVGTGMPGGYYQYRKLMEISNDIHRAKGKPLYVIGGYLPSPEPEYFLKKTGADICVIGEGEETIREVIKFNNLSDVKSIAYCDEDGINANKRRPPIKDIDDLRPAYHLFPMEYYRLLRRPRSENSDFVFKMISGRGCPFKCNFCYRMDEGFRARSNESIIDEIKYLKRTYNATFIDLGTPIQNEIINRLENVF